MQPKWKNLSIVPDRESIAFRLLTQLCPNGTSRHENGFICGKLPIYNFLYLYIYNFFLTISFKLWMHVGPSGGQGRHRALLYIYPRTTLTFRVIRKLPSASISIKRRKEKKKL